MNLVGNDKTSHINRINRNDIVEYKRVVNEEWQNSAEN